MHNEVWGRAEISPNDLCRENLFAANMAARPISDYDISCWLNDIEGYFVCT